MDCENQSWSIMTNSWSTQKLWSFHVTIYLVRPQPQLQSCSGTSVTLAWPLCFTVMVFFYSCTNRSAGEGLGGTTGGSFLISTWGGSTAWFGVWSRTWTPMVLLDVSRRFTFSSPRWTESEAVFVIDEDGVGFVCGKMEVEGWEDGALVWGSR